MFARRPILPSIFEVSFGFFFDKVSCWCRVSVLPLSRYPASHQYPMRSSSSISAIEALSRRLPFPLSDTAQLNRVFCRWHARQQRADLRVVELWTYCYVRRYFTIKYVQYGMDRVSDVDALVEKAFSRVQQGREHIDEKMRYASWVSVVCRNAYLNYVRQRRVMVMLEDERYEDMTQRPEEALDAEVAYKAVCQAIERLPVFLQEVARLRLLDEMSYGEISDATGKAMSIVRSYVSKAYAKLREDPVLLAATDQKQP